MDPRSPSPGRIGPALFLILAALPMAATAQTADPSPASPAPSVPPASVVPIIPPEVQVVKFSVPDGAKLEVLGPATEPLAGPPTGAVGLKLGVGYRLKLSDLPTAPGKELFPVVELVGHLHRPPGIDPTKYPIRIAITEDDVEDAADRGRLVTQAVYLEAPDQALPVSLPKDRIPAVTLSPVEDPLKVAQVLGRVVAVVRIGSRAPTFEELSGEAEWSIGSVPCPFSGPEGGRCPLPCGPVRGTPPPPGRSWLPRDEFLCDGGDHASPAAFGGDGGLRGIDPRDAVIRFRADQRPRVLPTNMVCLYAPRFAVLRSGVGANETRLVENLASSEIAAHQVTHQARQMAKKFTQNQSPEMARHRARASGMKGRVSAGEHFELRVLQGYDVPTHVAGRVLVQNMEVANQNLAMKMNRDAIKLQAIKTAEGAIVRGVVEGLGEKVSSWTSSEVAGVEVPPNKPGLAVVKQVSAGEAEPGDVVTFTIRYRNMGNVPIRDVSVIDSLLPRLEYVPNSAMGPQGTVFSAEGNAAGSSELRWDLPGAIAPGAEGSVEFRAKVR